MSTLISRWSGRNTAVMKIVNLGVCLLFLGAQSVEASDNRPGLELGSATVGLRETAACTPIHGFPETSVKNPSADPPPACPPTLAVHALGCTTCHPGETLGFEVHIKNPGRPMLVELKTGARLPDGSAVTILERHEEESIPSGVTVIPLFAGLVLPAGIPAGAYAIEAALLEPTLGVTLSRSRAPLILMP
jgi:hypothetical protein